MSNERLEFLGDAIVNYAVGALLFKRFPGLNEGEMSRMRAGLVCHDSLVRIADRIGLRPLVRVAPEYERPHARQSVLSDAMEALFAAVELDAGHEAAKALVERHMLALLESGQVDLQKDPKTALQEHLQARSIRLPTYQMVQKGEAGVRPFKASCSIPALGITTTGTGQNRKEAEKDAAAKALPLCPR
jgi:ribonuclease-3